MAKLKIKVENGTTKTTIDGQVVSGLKDLVARCRGDNMGDDKCRFACMGSPFGVDIASDEAEIQITIPETLANALKGGS